MPTLDVFAGSAFSTMSLTAAVNKSPFKPKFLGSLGLFQEIPITTTVAIVEEQRGMLSLLPTASRGALGDVQAGPIRQVRSFNVPYVPGFATILADDVQNIRTFGSETELESVAAKVNDRLVRMRDNHEATHEWHRIGAIKGQILDADGATTIYNLFTEFGVSETTEDFPFLTSTADLKLDAQNVIRGISDTLGDSSFTKIIALCGDTFFDRLITHASVKTAFERWQDGMFFRQTQLGPEYNGDTRGFDFAGITWLNYRGSVGGTAFVHAQQARFVPVGVNNLFQQVMAPADFMETVNTRGQLLYAKQQRLPFDKGIQLHTVSCVLMMCTRPACLFKGTGTYA